MDNTTRYKELMEKIRVNLNDDKRFAKQLEWFKERVEHYHQVLGFTQVEILEAFERKRDYLAANYYQDANFPLLDEKVKIFETLDELRGSIASRQFICPACNQVQSDPYECKSGFKDKNDKVCDWKSYGFFGTAGKGFRFTIKESFLEKPMNDDVFMPIEFKDTIYNPEYKAEKIDGATKC